VAKLDPTGSALVYSTYLGGSGDDIGFGIALDALPQPDAYVTGTTSSTNFPITPRAFQPAFGGGPEDAFVAKIAAPAFAGTPGTANCHGQSVSALARQFGGLDAAALVLRFINSVMFSDSLC